MSAAIGPGDFVECVDITPCRVCGVPNLNLGAIYRVEDVVRALRSNNKWGWLLILQGVRSAGTQGGFGLGRFRPVYRPSADLIRQLEQPAPDAVRELEDV
jgi:hypothetical protein